MEIEAKQRSQKNRRRERAQRMLAQRESLATAKQQQQQQQQQQSQQSRQRPPNDEEDSHSGEDEDPAGGGGGGGGLGLGLGAKTGHPRDGHSRPPRPPRPPRPRKKSSLVNAIPKEALFEEDIIDGFAILAFRTYEELEVRNTNRYVRIFYCVSDSHPLPLKQIHDMILFAMCMYLKIRIVSRVSR